MDLNFIPDPDLSPKSRSEIRIESLKVTPYPDKQRLAVQISTTAFTPADRPNLQITVLTAEGDTIASANVIESMHQELTLTIHLRGTAPSRKRLTVNVDLFYEEGTIQHSLQQSIDLPENAASLD